MPESYPKKSPPEEVPGLVRALAVLRERWWIVAVCMVVSLLVAVIYVERQPKQYTATAQLQFTSNSLPSEVAGVPSNQSLDPEGEKSTDQQLVTTTPVATLVVKALNLKVTPAELLSNVTASNPHDDYIVAVSAVSHNPNQAASIANAFAQQYVVYSQQQNENQLIKGEQLINEHLEKLPATDTVDRANLTALAQKLLLLQAVQTGNARVVDTAMPPSSPSSPKKTATAVVALVAGLLLGVGLSFLLNLIDRRVKSLDEFEEIYRIPALASIPRLPRRLRTMREREMAMEPFQILQNALALAPNMHGHKTVLVTSAVSGEGKTTVALGLARAAARSGQQVILVEADLRRPSFAQRLRLEGHTHGLISALADGENPLELLYSTPGLSQLKILPCGPSARNPTNLLHPDKLTRTFKAIGSQADLVVVDSAPLLPVADTRVLLDEVDIDVCVIVARAGVTKQGEARRARSVLDQRQLASVGLVVNAFSEIRNDYYYGSEDTEGEAAEHAEPVSIVTESR